MVAHFQKKKSHSYELRSSRGILGIGFLLWLNQVSCTISYSEVNPHTEMAKARTGWSHGVGEGEEGSHWADPAWDAGVRRSDGRRGGRRCRNLRGTSQGVGWLGNEWGDWTIPPFPNPFLPRSTRRVVPATYSGTIGPGILVRQEKIVSMWAGRRQY
jgi:hypothetical protein